MKRLFHSRNLKIWIVFIITLVIGIWSLSFLPETIPTHFDINGVPDNYGSKWTIFMAPGVTLGMILLAEVSRTIDPKASSYQRFEGYYYYIHFAVSLIMLFAQIYTIANVLEWNINLSFFLPLVLGGLFIFLGNMMPKFKHNYFVGIRTSWTLASEKVWYLTHRFAGKVYVIGGVLVLLSGFITRPPYSAWIMMISIGVFSILPVLMSYYYYRKYER